MKIEHATGEKRGIQKDLLILLLLSDQKKG